MSFQVEKLQIDGTTIPGETVTISCHLDSTDVASGVWYHEGSALSDGERHVLKTEGKVHMLTIKDLAHSDNGVYEYVIENNKAAVKLLLGEFVCEFK